VRHCIYTFFGKADLDFLGAPGGPHAVAVVSTHLKKYNIGTYHSISKACSFFMLWFFEGLEMQPLSFTSHVLQGARNGKQETRMAQTRIFAGHNC
jgi:hypothetical protein